MSDTDHFMSDTDHDQKCFCSKPARAIDAIQSIENELFMKSVVQNGLLRLFFMTYPPRDSISTFPSQELAAPRLRSVSPVPGSVHITTHKLPWVPSSPMASVCRSLAACKPLRGFFKANFHFLSALKVWVITRIEGAQSQFYKNQKEKKEPICYYL